MPGGASVAFAAVPFGTMFARAGVSLLLAASGALSIAAARERWWPACRPGDYDAPDCVTLQDHQYDFIAPTDPWVPVGNAAELAGLSIGVLAIAVGLLPWLLARSRPKVARAAGVVLFLTLVPFAAVTWLSGQAEQVVTTPLLLPVGLSWVFVWPLVWIVVIGVSLGSGDFTRAQLGARLLLLACLCLSAPLAQLLFAPVLVGYASYDTSPWTEATGGALLVVAALAAWPATGHGRPPPESAKPADDRAQETFAEDVAGRL